MNFKDKGIMLCSVSRCYRGEVSLLRVAPDCLHCLSVVGSLSMCVQSSVLGCMLPPLLQDRLTLPPTISLDLDELVMSSFFVF